MGQMVPDHEGGLNTPQMMRPYEAQPWGRTPFGGHIKREGQIEHQFDFLTHGALKGGEGQRVSDQVVSVFGAKTETT